VKRLLAKLYDPTLARFIAKLGAWVKAAWRSVVVAVIEPIRAWRKKTIDPILGKIAGALGLRPAFETARMWRGPAPSESLDRTFGVATFELG